VEPATSQCASCVPVLEDPDLHQSHIDVFERDLPQIVVCVCHRRRLGLGVQRRIRIVADGRVRSEPFGVFADGVYLVPESKRRPFGAQAHGTEALHEQLVQADVDLPSLHLDRELDVVVLSREREPMKVDAPRPQAVGAVILELQIWPLAHHVSEQSRLEQ
jgi:hypothetical protein